MGTLQEVSQMEGVKDLPMKVRAKFAKAIILESQGDYKGAEESLNAAIQAEAEDLAEKAAKKK